MVDTKELNKDERDVVEILLDLEEKFEAQAPVPVLDLEEEFEAQAPVPAPAQPEVRRMPSGFTLRICPRLRMLATWGRKRARNARGPRRPRAFLTAIWGQRRARNARGPRRPRAFLTVTWGQRRARSARGPRRAVREDGRVRVRRSMIWWFMVPRAARMYLLLRRSGRLRRGRRVKNARGTRDTAEAQGTDDGASNEVEVVRATDDGDSNEAEVVKIIDDGDSNEAEVMKAIVDEASNDGDIAKDEGHDGIPVETLGK
jgi:hypothetical protein